MSGKTGKWVKWTSVAVAIVSVVLIGRLLPTEALAQRLSGWVSGLGVWGYIAFAAIYVVGALLFVPGSAMTLAAGAVFGVAAGVVVVSIASTTAAALALLIARYLARGAVQRRVQHSPKFRAIDEAVSDGGGRVVLLLRLSPLMPFSIGNYLFGLTAVRFWSYVLASWAGMLPGTVVYVYLGFVGRSSVAGGERTAGEWSLLVAGLLASVAVTAYVTRLARKKIADRGVEPAPQSPAGDADRPAAPWHTAAFAALALSMALATATAYGFRDRLRSVAGPPAASLQEAHAETGGGVRFDHSVFDRLLREHVAEGGWIDYEALRQNPEALDRYIASLNDAPFADMGRDEKLALLINAYNAFTLRLILDHYPVKSIKDIPAEQRWKFRHWKLAGQTYSLDEIEHEQIRPKFREPRIHFALVCAAIGCPPLRREAYVGDRVNEQLDDQTRAVHGSERWLIFDPHANKLRLTSLYRWYGGDFEQVSGSVLDFVKPYVPELAESVNTHGRLELEWLHYDWSLNSKANAR